MLTVADCIERRFRQLGLNTVVDMTEVKIAMASQFKEMSFTLLVKVMEVANDEYSSTGQGKASRLFEYMGEAQFLLVLVCGRF